MVVVLSILILIHEPLSLCFLLPVDLLLQLDMLLLYPGNYVLELEIARTFDGREYAHFSRIPVPVICDEGGERHERGKKWRVKK